MIIRIDGTAYHVGVASIRRSIRKVYKYQVMTEDGVEHREARGTYMDFVLALGNVSGPDYDRLIDMLATTTGDVRVELPAGSGDIKSYTGVFDGIVDGVSRAEDDGECIWDDLSLSFIGTVPL